MRIVRVPVAVTQVEGKPVRGESADDHVRRAVHALAQAVDEPFRKSVVVIGAGGLHVRVVAIRPEPLEARAGALPPGDPRGDGFVAPYTFVAKTLRRIAFQLDPVKRDTERCHLRRRIGSFRDLWYTPGLEHGMNRVRIALIGERAGGMVGDAVGVVLGDIAQILGGQFRRRHRVAIAGPAGLCREVAEEGAVVWVLVCDPDLYQHGIGGGGVTVLGGYLE